MELMDIVVICTNCKQMAQFDPPDGNNPYGVWHWHQPCPVCGAESWAAHETRRNITTGRLIETT